MIVMDSPLDSLQPSAIWNQRAERSWGVVADGSLGCHSSSVACSWDLRKVVDFLWVVLGGGCNVLSTIGDDCVVLMATLVLLD